MNEEAGQFVNTVWATDWQKLGPKREKPWGCLLARVWQTNRGTVFVLLGCYVALVGTVRSDSISVHIQS